MLRSRLKEVSWITELSSQRRQGPGLFDIRAKPGFPWSAEVQERLQVVSFRKHDIAGGQPRFQCFFRCLLAMIGPGRVQISRHRFLWTRDSEPESQ